MNCVHEGEYVSVTEEGGGRDTTPKKRTPHRDVGKKSEREIYSDGKTL